MKRILAIGGIAIVAALLVLAAFANSQRQQAAMLTAQVARGAKFGMNSPGNDNRQLALNIMHWLSNEHERI